MASTNFVDFSTPIVAAWLNDINSFFYSLFAGATTPAQALTAIGALGSNNPTFTGNITSTSSGARFLADFSNTTHSNRLLFQTSTVNLNTSLGVIPNGTANSGNVNCYSSSDPNNASFFSINANSSAGWATVNSGQLGTGPYLPIVIFTGGAERMRIDTAGRVGIATTPYPWLPTIPVLEIGPGPSFPNGGTSLHSGQATTVITSNAYYDGVWKAKAADLAQQITMTNGTLAFNNAPSVAANAPLTFTERFRVDIGGNLVLPTPNPRIVSNGGLSLTTSIVNSPAAIHLFPNGTGNGSSLLMYNIVASGDQIILRLTSNSTSTFIENLNLGAATPVPMIFQQQNVERMRLGATGNLSVGVTTEFGRLNVRQQSATNAVAWFGNATAGDLAIPTLQLVKQDNNSTTAQKFIEFYMGGGGGASGQINANGAGQAAFGAFSDERLKENIVDLEPQLDNILALRPVEFDLKDGSGHNIGFIAQEVESIYPDVVGVGKNDMLTLTGMSKTEARLISAIQELAKRVAALEA